MDSELKKEAREAIYSLQEKNAELKEDLQEVKGDLENLELYKAASDLAFDLYEMGAIEASDIESKVAELSDKSLEELQVIEKAAELSYDGGLAKSLSLGDISDMPQSDGSMDPLTSMLLEDY